MKKWLFASLLVGFSIGTVTEDFFVRDLVRREIRKESSFATWELRDARKIAKARENDYMKVTGAITKVCGTELFIPAYSHSWAVRLIDKSQLSEAALKCLEIYRGIGWITE